ncbi:hypothetical protein GLOIN_2v1873907 [Rhizophagus irregularis DAOM 181602=DAOM 197198]|nr:hypothetical protein GLOIN_2v1873907 [Rhizophagus irregularis DAOM 181602=DAOM 197198]CAB4478747.1 unnamed protein product [Rhizophagus irregularis]
MTFKKNNYNNNINNNPHFKFFLPFNCNIFLQKKISQPQYLFKNVKTKKKMQQILKIFIVLAFIIAVIATPVPVQKRQGKTPKCPTTPTESTESDTYPVSSDGKELKPINCP